MNNADKLNDSRNQKNNDESNNDISKFFYFECERRRIYSRFEFI
jgi:hypothetical protein